MCQEGGDEAENDADQREVDADIWRPPRCLPWQQRHFAMVANLYPQELPNRGDAIGSQQLLLGNASKGFATMRLAGAASFRQAPAYIEADSCCKDSAALLIQFVRAAHHGEEDAATHNASEILKQDPNTIQ